MCLLTASHGNPWVQKNACRWKGEVPLTYQGIRAGHCHEVLHVLHIFMSICQYAVVQSTQKLPLSSALPKHPQLLAQGSLTGKGKDREGKVLLKARPYNQKYQSKQNTVLQHKRASCSTCTSKRDFLQADHFMDSPPDLIPYRRGYSCLGCKGLCRLPGTIH